MALPFVQVRGDAYAQGLAHGAALKTQIAHNVAVYFERFEREVKLSRAEVHARAGRYAAAIREAHPDYYAGMQGIAAGAGFDLETIAALNVRYELFYFQFGVLADGCTAFTLLPEVTSTNTLLIGENWDWIAGIKGAVVHASEPEGATRLFFTEAGIFGGKIGLNQHGLGLVINGLTSNDDDWARLHSPFHVRCYEILRSATLSAARNFITEGERSCSANFLLAQVPDQAVNFETAPRAVGEIRSEGGCIVHANHFVDPARLGIREPQIEKNPHSYRRHQYLYEQLAAKRPLSVEDAQAALRNHRDHPYSVCFHIDPSEPPEEHYETVASVVMDLHRLTMWVSDGPPCSNPYETYQI